jgi:hypothetical protein
LSYPLILIASVQKLLYVEGKTGRSYSMQKPKFVTQPMKHAPVVEVILLLKNVNRTPLRVDV